MALITNADIAWAGSVTLQGNEVWQARAGSVFLSTTQNPGPEDGILLTQGQAVQLSAGLEVVYRKGSLSEAVIVRERI